MPNKKLRNLRKRLRHSKNVAAASTTSLNKQIELLRQEVAHLNRKLSDASRDSSAMARENVKALEIYKELECFRVAVNNSYPFRGTAPCDLFTVQMQIDMRSFEYGMFKASANRLMPMCKILDYVRYDLARNVIQKIEHYLKEKGINVQY